MLSKARLKWMTVLLPVLFVTAFEQLRHGMIASNFNRPVIETVSVAILTGGALFFSYYVFRNIEQMDQNLAQEQQKIKALFDNASDAMAIIDDRGLVVALNPSAEKLVGWKAEEVVGRKTCPEIFGCTEAAGSALKPHRCCAMASLEYGRRVPYAEMMVRTRDGGRIPVTGSSSPLRMGQARGAAVVLRDLSEKRKMEDRINSLYEDALRYNRQVETLHGIGMQMSSIINFEGNLPVVLKRIGELFEADFAALGVKDGDGPTRWQRFPAAQGEVFWNGGDLGEWPGMDGDTEVPRVFSLSRECLEERPQAVLLAEGLVTCLAVPLQARGKVFGVLLLGSKRERDLDVGDLRLLETVAAQVSTALENLRLYRRVQDAAVLEERERIAREMHDGMAQSLSYLSFQLATIDRLMEKGKLGEVKGEIEEMRRLVDETYREVRQAIFDLKTGSQVNGCLVDNLRGYVREFAARSNLECQVEITAQDFRLAPSVQLQVFRIVQEALANVRKHAGASRVRVGVNQVAGMLTVSVVDDGKGFEEDSLMKSEGRYGLAIMRERAESVGGVFELESQPGIGTKISVAVPLDGEGGVFNGPGSYSVG